MINTRLAILFLVLLTIQLQALSQVKTALRYTVYIPEPSSHKYHVALAFENPQNDTVVLKMPKWMPGYYQIMDYAKSVDNILVKDKAGKEISYFKTSDNTLRIAARKKSFIVNYDITTTRQFVATSYVETDHAYIVTAGTFYYPDGFIHLPVTVEVKNPWSKSATGLEPVPGKANVFTAENFDILFDCPILLGDLEELPSFRVKGIEHRFIGYKIGTFDKIDFMKRLQKITEAAVEIIGDIPYKQYTYIAIGPGRGGIEHLNNTTVSFDGNNLNDASAMNRMMNFLAHEYFHHYNVKRIRPLELGPFDYDQGSRTNMLWLSEGLSVYYEYLVVKRADLVDEKTVLSNLEGNINAHENNPGKAFQSLKQASYNTWKDGPFGTQGDEKGKSISYYDKGPIIGLLLDLGIRQSTENKKSLDDVMRLLYWRYYKEKGRGISDAEVEQACEEVAAASLKEIFEYIYTTKEMDYNKYLGFAGLRLEETPPAAGSATQNKKFKIVHTGEENELQHSILKSWLGE
jgi:predicted metalloprotease with PDZ domain